MFKNLFSRCTLLLGMALFAVACSQNDEIPMQNAPSREEPGKDGLYHYKMQLDCQMPSFDDEEPTRAVYYDRWEDNQVIFLRFKNGSSWIVGQASYSKSENIWNVGTYQTLPVVSGTETCEMYYFEHLRDFDSKRVVMDENTACYVASNGSYTHSDANSIGMTGVLNKKTWRIRFSGTPGSSVILPSSDNDIYYYTGLNLSTGSFTPEKKKVTLTVGTDGYTPYIYGDFSNTGNNRITVYNGNYGFSRNISSNNLTIGDSGCMSIPTVSSHDGWTQLTMDEYLTNLISDPNLYTKPNEVMVLTDKFACTWTTGSNTIKSYWSIMRKNDVDSSSDLDLYNELISDDPVKGIESYRSGSSSLTPDTDYYMLTLSVNSSNLHSAIIKYPFHTPSDINQPLAKMSNFEACTIDGEDKWRMDITLYNTTKYYHIDSEDYYDTADLFFAFDCYGSIMKGDQPTYNLKGGIIWNRNNQTRSVVLTWAINGSGDLSGQVDIARATVSRSDAVNSSRASKSSKKIIQHRDGSISEYKRPLVLKQPIVKVSGL